MASKVVAWSFEIGEVEACGCGWEEGGRGAGCGPYPGCVERVAGERRVAGGGWLCPAQVNATMTLVEMVARTVGKSSDVTKLKDERERDAKRRAQLAMQVPSSPPAPPPSLRTESPLPPNLPFPPYKSLSKARRKLGSASEPLPPPPCQCPLPLPSPPKSFRCHHSSSTSYHRSHSDATTKSPPHYSLPHLLRLTARALPPSPPSLTQAA